MDRILGFLMLASVLALMGAGFREYLIHNGKLTSDLNANGFSITNLPAGFFPDMDVSGTLAEFARTNKVLSSGPYLRARDKPQTGETIVDSSASNLVIYGSVSTTRTGAHPMVVGWRFPFSYMDLGSISLGGFGWGWTLDEAGFHRHLTLEYTNGPAISFPEDAYETGGVLALRSDIPDVSGFATQADVADATNALAQSIGGAADLAPMTNYVDAATNAIMTLARAKTDMNVYGEERSAVWVASAPDGYDVAISGAEWVDWGESDFTGYFFSGTIARGGDSHEFMSVQAMESYPTGTDPATVGEAAFEVGFDGATVAVSVSRTVVAPTGDMLATTGQVAAATNALDRAIRADFPSGTPEWRTARFWAEAGESLSFVTNGAAEFHIGYVSGFGVDTNGWPEGAALFVRGTYDTGYALESLPGNVRLAGYGEWPTNDFQSVWWRMGTNVFVNVLVEE